MKGTAIRSVSTSRPIRARRGQRLRTTQTNTSKGELAPTVAVATDDGIVFGTDNGNDGLWVLVRGSEASGLVHAWEWESDYSLNGFANRGVRDPVSGIVYVGFQSDRSDMGAVITASDGVTAAEVWEDVGMQGEYSNVVAYDGNIRGGVFARKPQHLFRVFPAGERENMSKWYTDATVGTAAVAPDIAAYDTAGDIDVRLDIAPDSLAVSGRAISRFNSGFLWNFGTSSGNMFGQIYDSSSLRKTFRALPFHRTSVYRLATASTFAIRSISAAT